MEQLKDTGTSDATSISDDSNENDNDYQSDTISEEDVEQTNRPDIDEDFLLQIADPLLNFGINNIVQNLHRSTLEENTRTYHTLEPRRGNSKADLQQPQFTDQDNRLSIHSSSSQASSQASTQDSTQASAQVICDLCSKKYTVRGITKHRNNCLKKRSIIN